MFYIGRKTNAATAPGAERSHTHKAHAPTPTGNSALTRGAPHTGSDIRLKPHMNGAKAAGPKTMAMRRAYERHLRETVYLPEAHAFSSQHLRARALEYPCAPGGVSKGAGAVPSAREAR